MDIIPAIDILGGKCVRLRQGNFASKTVYSNDPVEVAKRFQKAGLKRVHLIDLDGAKEGAIQNWKTIENVATHTTLSITCGGGVRTREDIERLLRVGVDKVIVGSLAVTEPEKFKEIVRGFGKSIVVGVDVKGNTLWYYGWQKKSEKELYPFLLQTAHFGAQAFICTDIDRDGSWDLAERVHTGFTTGDHSRRLYFKEGFGPGQSVDAEVEFVKPEFFRPYE